MRGRFASGADGNCCWLVLVMIQLVVMVGNGLDSAEFQRNLPAKVVWAVPGKDAELPCDVTPALPHDNVTMVFWFKDTIGMPLYSLDARGVALSNASHLAMTDELGVRTYFVTDETSSKARLRIRNVTMNDQGIFRCRVDFVNSPTRNFQVNLTLVVQPSAPRIFDAVGREIKVGAPAGSFREGHGLFLSCQVHGGNPRPTLTWWFNNTLLDGVVDSSRKSPITVNQLMIKSVERHFKGAKLECRASSSDLAGYVTREVPLVVYLKPSKVKIVTPNDLLSTRKTANVRCETFGSYPSANLTWLLGGEPIRNAVTTEEKTDSFTGSIIALLVTAADDGKELTCRADNSRFPGESKSDSRKIHVAYPPKVSVVLESGSSSVNEGADVILRCQNSARPLPYSYSWYQDNHLVPYNETAGLLPIDNTLTLKNVSRHSGGQYACSAINTEGETYSSPLGLVVQYAPRCKKGFDKIQVGGLPEETLKVQCNVDAVPPVTRYSWTYNTSGGVFPVQGARAHNKGDISVLEFALGDGDIESLSCWATNDIGKQKRPCEFVIVSAAPPEPPQNCLVHNAPHDGIEISCLAGNDGGLHQSFVLELTDLSEISAEVPPGITTLSDQGERVGPTSRLVGDRPIFRLHNLKAGREYQGVVYSENAKGRSQPQLLPNVKIKSSRAVAVPPVVADVPDSVSDGIADTIAPPGASSSDGPGLTVVIAGVAASGVLLIIAVIVATTTLVCRRKTSSVQRRERSRSKPPSELELSEAGFGDGFHRRSALYRASMYGECEERISRLIEGPDLILAPVSFSNHNSDY